MCSEAAEVGNLERPRAGEGTGGVDCHGSNDGGPLSWPLSSLHVCQMKRIRYKLRHSLKAVFVFAALALPGVLVFPSKKTHRGYFVKFVRQLFFFPDSFYFLWIIMQHLQVGKFG